MAVHPANGATPVRDARRPGTTYGAAMTTNDSPLTALLLNCTLSPSPAESSTELLGRQVLDALAEHGVTGTEVRVVDHDIRPGVDLDMGDGDEWPAIRRQVMAADILVLATPIWLGQHSSVAQRVLERLDAELSETDDEGRLLTFGKVAVVAVEPAQAAADMVELLVDLGVPVVAVHEAERITAVMRDNALGTGYQGA